MVNRKRLLIVQTKLCLLIDFFNTRLFLFIGQIISILRS